MAWVQTKKPDQELAAELTEKAGWRESDRGDTFEPFWVNRRLLPDSIREMYKFLGHTVLKCEVFPDRPIRKPESDDWMPRKFVFKVTLVKGFVDFWALRPPREKPEEYYDDGKWKVRTQFKSWQRLPKTTFRRGYPW